MASAAAARDTPGLSDWPAPHASRMASDPTPFCTRSQTPLSEGSEGDDEESDGAGTPGDEASDADLSAARSPESRAGGRSMFAWNPEDDDAALPSPMFALSRVTSDAERLGPSGGSGDRDAARTAGSRQETPPATPPGASPPSRLTAGGPPEMEPPTPGPGIRSAAYSRLRTLFAGSQTEDEGAGSAAEQSLGATPTGLGVTPLQRYIDYRCVCMCGGGKGGREGGEWGA